MPETKKFIGDGKLLEGLFDLLKDLSDRVGFDVWHQFTCINPMKFMGLLDDNNLITVDRLEDYGKLIQKKADDSVWCNENNTLQIKKKLVEKEIERITSNLKSLPLYESEGTYVC